MLAFVDSRLRYLIEDKREQETLLDLASRYRDCFLCPSIPSVIDLKPVHHKSGRNCQLVQLVRESCLASDCIFIVHTYRRANDFYFPMPLQHIFSLPPLSDE